MAVLPTKEENARKVLKVYDYFRFREGHVLRANNFVAVGSGRRWDMSDLQQGLEVALEKGLIRNKNGGFELTETGFREM